MTHQHLHLLLCRFVISGITRFGVALTVTPCVFCRCLDDNGWDYQKAAQIFINLQTEGKIPPEAFAK